MGTFSYADNCSATATLRNRLNPRRTSLRQSNLHDEHANPSAPHWRRRLYRRELPLPVLPNGSERLAEVQRGVEAREAATQILGTACGGRSDGLDGSLAGLEMVRDSQVAPYPIAVHLEGKYRGERISTSVYIRLSPWKHSGGEGGIRTLGTGVSPYNGLANRRIRPLCHLSGG